MPIHTVPLPNRMLRINARHPHKLIETRKGPRSITTANKWTTIIGLTSEVHVYPTNHQDSCFPLLLHVPLVPLVQWKSGCGISKEWVIKLVIICTQNISSCRQNEQSVFRRISSSGGDWELTEPTVQEERRGTITDGNTTPPGHRRQHFHKLHYDVCNLLWHEHVRCLLSQSRGIDVVGGRLELWLKRVIKRGGVTQIEIIN